MASKFDEKDVVNDTPPNESPSFKDGEWGQVGHPDTYIKPQARLLHDPDVSMEEYNYYAARTREIEKGYESPKTEWGRLITKRKTAAHNVNDEVQVPENVANTNFAKKENRIHISDKEWEDASRALRTASWGASFYLITTDILGPYSVGFAFGTLGWGPGIGLFTVFGLMAGYSGYLLWKIFIGLDSYQFPARNYGDIAFRTWGKPLRHLTNFLQALALLLILGQVTIQNGQNLSEVSKFRLCYIVCPLLFVIAGYLLTQIRTLKAFGLVANLAVWLNLLVIFMTMGFMSASPPNYHVAPLGSAGAITDPATITPDKNGVYPPVIHYAGLPTNNLVGSINGLLSGVLGYAGAQLFIEFMAEMKRPNDFLKAMWGAQLFIYVVYMSYGSFVYYYQGQYSYSPSYQGVSVYGWQTAGNMISLLGGLIAGALYGNIGVKVLYNNVLMEWFNCPPLQTKTGKIMYAILVPIFWSTAFVIAAAIPDYFGFVSVMSASTLLNLVYTLPPLYALGYDCQRNAVRASQGEGFDPTTGEVRRDDNGWKRFWRGYFAGGPLQVAQNIWNSIYFLASLAMCGLGMYAAIQGMIDTFENPQLTSFSCQSPLNLNAA